MTFYIYNIECPITEERKSMITKMYVLLQFAIVYFTDLNDTKSICTLQKVQLTELVAHIQRCNVHFQINLPLIEENVHLQGYMYTNKVESVLTWRIPCTYRPLKGGND